MLPPQTVNAYYSAATNEMVIPAAILQPPIFDLGADDAVNYGATGALIGHEIGHAFDDRGRRFDGAGAVRDWWTQADADGYRERVSALVAQMNAYEPLPGLHVNGALTAPESMGDLGGLDIAFRAYKLSLKGRRAPVIDGLTGEQRFFMGWAQIWRSKERDEYLRSTLQINAYLPPALRANAAASNVDGFFDAFGVKPGNRLYRAPARAGQDLVNAARPPSLLRRDSCQQNPAKTLRAAVAARLVEPLDQRAAVGFDHPAGSDVVGIGDELDVRQPFLSCLRKQ